MKWCDWCFLCSFSSMYPTHIDLKTKKMLASLALFLIWTKLFLIVNSRSSLFIKMFIYIFRFYGFTVILAPICNVRTNVKMLKTALLSSHNIVLDRYIWFLFLGRLVWSQTSNKLYFIFHILCTWSLCWRGCQKREIVFRRVPRGSMKI